MIEPIRDADRRWVLERLEDPVRGAATSHPHQRWLSEVVRLQPAAVAKLGPPPSGIWWVTDRSLQQATAEPVAVLKASWIKPFERTIADVCCGIGGDLVRWATDRPAMAVDRDPQMLAMAAANLGPAAAPVQLLSPRRRIHPNRRLVAL